MSEFKYINSIEEITINEVAEIIIKVLIKKTKHK